MPRGMGRPMAAVVLSDGERSFLEAQVRRHRVARSMMPHDPALRRGSGQQGGGGRRHTVGKWRPKDRSTGCWTNPGRGGPGRGREGGGGDRADADHRPGRATHSLRSMAKEAGLAHDDLAHLGRLRPAAAPGRDLQTLQRSEDKPTSWASTCRRRIARWCCASTKRARSRRSTAPSRCCRCARHPRAAHPRLQAQPLFAALDVATARIEVLPPPPGERVPRLPQGDGPKPPRRARHPHRHGPTPTRPRRSGPPRRPQARPRRSASWLNQVERWFAELTRKLKLRRAPFQPAETSAPSSTTTRTQRNGTRSVDDILAAVSFCLRVEQNLCDEL